MTNKHVNLLVSTIVRVVVRETHPQIMFGDPHLIPDQSPFTGIAGDKTRTAALRRVLVVDDETVVADSVAMILNRSGYVAEAQYSGTAALASIQTRCPDIIVSDVVMPDFNGIQLARAVQSLCPDARIILFSGNVSASTLLDDASMEGHVFEILAKPVHPLTLLKALEDQRSR